MLENSSTLRFLQGFIIFLFVISLNSNVSAQNDANLFLEEPQINANRSTDNGSALKKRRKSKRLSVTSIDISGGLLYDIDDFFNDQPTEYQNEIGKNNYLGFNYLSIGLNSENGETIIGAALEVSFLRIEPTPKKTTFPGGYFSLEPVTNREKIQSQIIFYFGKPLIKTSKYRLYWGPMASLLYSYEDNTPTSFPYFGFNDQEFGIGLGLKIQSQFQLTKNFGLTLGTRYFILDGIMDFERLNNPSLPLRLQRQTAFTLELLRKELVLQVGLNFKL